jgi:hypothetical protein
MVGNSFTPIGVSPRERLSNPLLLALPTTPEGANVKPLLLSDGAPVRSGRNRNSGQRLGADVGASAGARPDPVPPAIDRDGIQEMLVSVTTYSTIRATGHHEWTLRYCPYRPSSMLNRGP